MFLRAFWKTSGRGSDLGADDWPHKERAGLFRANVALPVLDLSLPDHHSNNRGMKSGYSIIPKVKWQTDTQQDYVTVNVTRAFIPFVHLISIK